LKTPKEAYISEFMVPTVKHGKGSVMVCAAMSVGSIITLHGQITAREYVNRLGNQLQPMIQTLFANNNAVFQDNNAPIHTAGTFNHGL
jgi:hypothetical protein